ncbi:hypothetical protein PFISCL1PPCAC_13866, partial [Pristionchus fissidentatus]
SSLFTIHPIVFFVLLRHSTEYSRDIKCGYVAYQIVCMLHEFNESFLYRVVNLCPYPGLYCQGPLCRGLLPERFLLVPLFIAIPSVIVPFYFLSLRMYHYISSHSETAINISKRMQIIIILVLFIILSSNLTVHLFSSMISRDTLNLTQIPELSWFKYRAGSVLLFGTPGHNLYFTN